MMHLEPPPSPATALQPKSGVLIGLVGRIGSGKSTAQSFLCEAHGFVALNFADRLKDVVAVMFGWDRALLQGDTPESRMWREQTDACWSEALGRPAFSPRAALQFVGTEMVRNQLGKGFWCAAMKGDIAEHLAAGRSVVIADVRFPEEIDLVRSLGGEIWRIERPRPAEVRMDTPQARVQHESETACLDAEVDWECINDGSLEQLRERVLARFRRGC
jgi:hypothetical protein